MNESPSNAMSDKGFSESCKLFFDSFKHLTTLSTGSIVLIVTLVTKVFSAPKTTWLIAGAVIALMVAIISSVLAMFFLAVRVQDLSKGKDDKTRNSNEVSTMLAISAFGATFGFIIGLGFLATFTAINF